MVITLPLYIYIYKIRLLDSVKINFKLRISWVGKQKKI